MIFEHFIIHHYTAKHIQSDFGKYQILFYDLVQSGNSNPTQPNPTQQYSETHTKG